MKLNFGEFNAVKAGEVDQVDFRKDLHRNISEGFCAIGAFSEILLGAPINTDQFILKANCHLGFAHAFLRKAKAQLRSNSELSADEKSFQAKELEDAEERIHELERQIERAEEAKQRSSGESSDRSANNSDEVLIPIDDSSFDVSPKSSGSHETSPKLSPTKRLNLMTFLTRAGDPAIVQSEPVEPADHLKLGSAEDAYVQLAQFGFK